MSVLSFPLVAQPKVSVVMATWGRGDLAMDALKALEAHTEPCYEVIVVDNASPDGTGARLVEELEGARVIRLRSNAGFGGGTNLGAMHSVAPALCFLNSDAIVTPGWLSPLLARLRSDDGIAAVSPCLLNADGTLQEAGSHLKRSGLSFAYGGGDDPDRPPYRFSREIDYGSAACLLVRRRAFEEVGGFDALFHPAYFEDVDLCLQFRARHWRTVFEPASRVIHVRHGSSTSDAARAQIEANRVAFFGRWGPSLSGRPRSEAPELHVHSTVGCRDALSHERILFIDDRVPFSDRGSGDPRSQALVLEMARLWPRARLTFLAVHPHEAPRYADPLWAAGVEVVWGAPDWARWLEERQFHYSVVIVSRPHNHEQLDPAIRRTQPQALRVYDVEALSFRRLESQARLQSSPSAAAALRAEAERTRRVEADAVSSADAVWTVSEVEASFVSGVSPGTPVFRLVYPIEPLGEPPGFAERSDLLFFGGFLAGPGSPNEDALRYVAESVLPRLAALDPSVVLKVVGADPTEYVRGLERPGIEIVGYVRDPSPWLTSARLLLAPVRFGAGIKLKLLDAMAAGLPFVTTSLGAEGLGLGDLERILVADEPAELTRKAWQLLSSPALWAEAQERLLDLAERRFGAPAFADTLVEAMAAVGIAPPPDYWAMTSQRLPDGSVSSRSTVRMLT